MRRVGPARHPNHLESAAIINNNKRLPAANHAARDSFMLHLICEYDIESPHRAARIAVPLVEGKRRFRIVRGFPDDDEKPVTVPLVIEAANALFIADGFY